MDKHPYHINGTSSQFTRRMLAIYKLVGLNFLGIICVVVVPLPQMTTTVTYQDKKKWFKNAASCWVVMNYPFIS